VTRLVGTGRDSSLVGCAPPTQITGVSRRGPQRTTAANANVKAARVAAAGRSVPRVSNEGCTSAVAANSAHTTLARAARSVPAATRTPVLTTRSYVRTDSVWATA
jgi:hypothetical protein